MGSVNCNYLPYIGNWIIVSAVHFWDNRRCFFEYWHLLGIKKCSYRILSSTNLMKQSSFFIRCSILFNFCINVVTFLWEMVDILSILLFLSKLETPISLVIQYLNYPRIVASGISNNLVFTALAPWVLK